MKHSTYTLCTACMLGLLTLGCQKQEETTTPPPAEPTATAPASPSPTTPAADAQSATPASPAAVVQEVTTEMAAEAEALLSKAQDQLTELKYADAATTLDQLSNQSLTAEQQPMLKSLKDRFSNLNSQLEEKITEAKTQVEKGEYASAADLIERITSIQLTSDQQKIVDDLQSKIETALKESAVDKGKEVLGGLLQQ